jgi:hypothetical protein
MNRRADVLLNAVGLAQAPGDTFTLKLRFEKSGAENIQVEVKE